MRTKTDAGPHSQPVSRPSSMPRASADELRIQAREVGETARALEITKQAAVVRELQSLAEAGDAPAAPTTAAAPTAAVVGAAAIAATAAAAVGDAAAKPGGEKGRTSKAPKDPAAFELVPSPFLRYWEGRRKQLKDEQPALHAHAIMTTIAKEWDALEPADKKPYFLAYAKEKETQRAAMAAHTGDAAGKPAALSDDDD